MVFIKRVGIILLCLVFITGCFNSTKNLKSNERFKVEYEKLNNKKIDGKKLKKVSISKDNKIKYSRVKDVVEMIENGDTFDIFFGFPKDPYTRNVVEELLRAEKDVNLDTLYYVNIEKVRDEFEVNNGKLICTKTCSNEYLRLVDILDKYLDEYVIKYEGKKYNTNTKRLDSPCVISFIDGKVDYYTTDPYKKVTKEQKNYAYNMFKCALKCIKKASGKNVCVKSNAC